MRQGHLHARHHTASRHQCQISISNLEKKSSLNSSLVSTFQQRQHSKSIKRHQRHQPSTFPSTLALDPMAPDRGSFRGRWLALVALVALALDLGGRCFAVEGRRGTALQQVRPEGHPGHEAWQKKWNNDDTPGSWYYHIIHEIVLSSMCLRVLKFFCF